MKSKTVKLKDFGLEKDLELFGKLVQNSTLTKSPVSPGFAQPPASLTFSNINQAIKCGENLDSSETSEKVSARYVEKETDSRLSQTCSRLDETQSVNSSLDPWFHDHGPNHHLIIKQQIHRRDSWCDESESHNNQNQNQINIFHTSNCLHLLSPTENKIPFWHCPFDPDSEAQFPDLEIEDFSHGKIK